jgi:hypothetical protein
MTLGMWGFVTLLGIVPVLVHEIVVIANKLKK